MTPENKKEIQTRLKAALIEEHLFNAQAARILNFNPAYIAMMLNKKAWDHCPAKAWARVEEALRAGKISDFKIHEGETLYENRVKASKRMDAEMFCKVNKDKEPAGGSSLKPEDQSPVDPPPPPVRNGRRMTEDELQKVLNKIGNLIPPENNITQRLRVALDIEITLIVNGQKVTIA